MTQRNNLHVGEDEIFKYFKTFKILIFLFWRNKIIIIKIENKLYLVIDDQEVADRNIRAGERALNCLRKILGELRLFINPHKKTPVLFWRKED